MALQEQIGDTRLLYMQKYVMEGRKGRSSVCVTSETSDRTVLSSVSWAPALKPKES